VIQREFIQVNKIDALVVLFACATWRSNACGVGLQHCAAGLAKADTHLSGTDSSATNVNIPVVSLSVPLTAAALL